MDKRDFQDLIIMGIFNFPKLCWSNGSVSSISSDKSIEYDFFDTLNENYLNYHVNIPTFQLSNEKCENTLDLELKQRQDASVN